MSLDGLYDPDNIFARIVRGEADAAKVFEDSDTLAIMDLFPQARGHSLVIHKSAPARNLLDVDTRALQVLILTVKRVAWAVSEALRPDGLLVTQFNGAAAGQTIFHLHFHIIPRWRNTPVGQHGGAPAANLAELKELAAQIASRLR